MVDSFFPEYDRIKPQESNMAAHSFHAHLAHEPEKSNVLNWLLLYFCIMQPIEHARYTPIMTQTPLMHDNASANQYELRHSM